MTARDPAVDPAVGDGAPAVRAIPAPLRVLLRALPRALLTALLTALVLAGSLAGSGRALAAPAPTGWPRPTTWPLAGAPPVLRGFDPPDLPYGAGHRGVDLGGLAGQPVLAAAAGTVVFAGRVGNLDVVTVEHGTLRTTYSPVRATVRPGTRVQPGTGLGTLEPGHCPDLGGDRACLHWGLLAGRDYLDPLLLVPADGSAAKYRLVSAAERSAVLGRQRAAAALAAAYDLGPTRRLLGPTGWTSAGARAAVAFAAAQLGKPYVFGATGPGAYDCSGLTMRAWEAGGVEIGHYTGVQWTRIRHVSAGELRPGDLVFWGTTDDPATIYHTALYLGGGRIIQAPRPGRSVEISALGDWIAPTFFGRPG